MIDHLLSKAKVQLSLWQKRTDYDYSRYGDREYYYHKLFTERNISSLLHWVSLKRQAVYNPHIQLAFRDIPFGASTKDVRRHFGKPRFVIQNPQVAQHKVFFYRFSISQLRSIAALHFIEDEFFLASHTFKQISARNYHRVLEVLANKYGVIVAERETAVKDSHDHVVLVQPSLYLSVRYVSGHPRVADYLTQLSTKKESLQQLREEQNQAIISEFL